MGEHHIRARRPGDYTHVNVTLHTSVYDVLCRLAEANRRNLSWEIEELIGKALVAPDPWSVLSEVAVCVRCSKALRVV